MFPPNFKLVQDNVEYDEPENEFDIVNMKLIIFISFLILKKKKIKKEWGKVLRLYIYIKTNKEIVRSIDGWLLNSCA